MKQMQTTPPALIVSIHDLSPLTGGRVKDMLEDLRKVGVAKTSLLVIPNHHHKAPITEDAAFAEWVRELDREGHEIVGHGYYHLREAKKGQTLGQKLVTESYTAGEGEFFDPDVATARGKLTRLKEDFAACGFKTDGFIAPAWLLGKEATEAVKQEGFRYTTRLGGIEWFSPEGSHKSQSLVWSVRAGWRRVISLGWNAWLFRALKSNPVMRVGLHPPDWDHPRIREQILDLIRQALAHRQVMTYHEWVARERCAS